MPFVLEHVNETLDANRNCLIFLLKNSHQLNELQNQVKKGNNHRMQCRYCKVQDCVMSYVIDRLAVLLSALN